MPIGPMGYTYRQKDIEETLAKSSSPIFIASASPLYESGKGKIVCLWQPLIDLMGRFPVHEQTIGDCVSHAFGLGIDVLQAVEIIRNGDSEQWIAETSTEAIYALSRVERGGGRLGSGDGSVGAWAADAVSKWGTLWRKQYGKYDLRQYSGKLAKQWGMPRAGLPDDLEPEAKPYIVGTTSMVTSYEAARDAIANGYPVTVCSNQGFSDVRDSEGFARPSGSWAHAMVFIAVDDASRRPGLCCQNSWGPSWNSGPKRHNQPDGSFWVDADVANRMLSRDPDSWALSNYRGFPKRKLDFAMI